MRKRSPATTVRLPFAGHGSAVDRTARARSPAAGGDSCTQGQARQHAVLAVEDVAVVETLAVMQDDCRGNNLQAPGAGRCRDDAPEQTDDRGDRPQPLRAQDPRTGFTGAQPRHERNATAGAAGAVL